MDDELKQARIRMALGALEGVIRAGEDLLGAATQLAPVAEGTLRGSGTLTVIVSGARFEGAAAKSGAAAVVRALAGAGRPINIELEVSFNTVYAARQHEELGWQHPKGGQAKYLEQPLRERSGRYERIITAAAGGAL